MARLEEELIVLRKQLRQARSELEEKTSLMLMGQEELEHGAQVVDKMQLEREILQRELAAAEEIVKLHAICADTTASLQKERNAARPTLQSRLKPSDSVVKGVNEHDAQQHEPFAQSQSLSLRDLEGAVKADDSHELDQEMGPTRVKETPRLCGVGIMLSQVK